VRPIGHVTANAMRNYGCTGQPGYSWRSIPVHDALRRGAAGAPLRSCATSTTRSDPITRLTPATPTRAR
jgi:hypothetical protein